MGGNTSGLLQGSMAAKIPIEMDTMKPGLAKY